MSPVDVWSWETNVWSWETNFPERRVLCHRRTRRSRRGRGVVVSPALPCGILVKRHDQAGYWGDRHEDGSQLTERLGELRLYDRPTSAPTWPNPVISFSPSNIRFLLFCFSEATKVVQDMRAVFRYVKRSEYTYRPRTSSRVWPRRDLSRRWRAQRAL